MKKFVYTAFYQPFVMGDDVHQPIGTTVEVSEEFELGKGFHGVIAVAPWGEVFVAEATTGAFVGSGVDQVKADIAECDDIKFMSNQVEEARPLAEYAQRLTPDQFWGRFRRGNRERSE